MIDFGDASHVLSGITCGYFSGFIPGVGNLVTLLLVYPFLLDSSLLQLLLFYMALTSVSQFSGSVVATVFGVPGEASSLPAVREGKRLFSRGLGNIAISNAAMGSVIGSFIALCLVLLALPTAVDLIIKFYNNNIQSVILLLASFSVILLLGHNKIQNVFIFALGFLLSCIGELSVPPTLFADNYIPYELFPELLVGLPLFPVMVSLYVFPVLLQVKSQFKDYKTDRVYEDKTPALLHIKEFFSNIGSSLRGSFIGSFIGLVPHVGTAVGTNLSYAFERFLGKRKGKYRKDGDIKSLVSAETSNNATNMTGLMPLLLIGIPISGSETLLLAIIELNTYIVNYTTTIETNLFLHLCVWFVIVNAIGLILCWPAVKYVNILQKVNVNYMLIGTGILLIGLVLYTGSLDYDMWYHLTVLLVLAPLGYFLRKTEPLVLMIAFMLQDKILEAFYAFYQINLL